VSDWGRFVATAHSQLGEDVVVMNAGVLLSADECLVALCVLGCVSGYRSGLVKGPDRPLLFAPTGAGREPLLLGSEGLAPLSER
jgi:hypothetical protein